MENGSKKLIKTYTFGQDIKSNVQISHLYMLFREKVEIPATMSYIWVEGEGAEKTIIEWGDTADHMGDNGRPMGTFASATFAVNSPFFIARNITFKVNLFNRFASKQKVKIRSTGLFLFENYAFLKKKISFYFYVKDTF